MKLKTALSIFLIALILNSCSEHNKELSKLIAINDSIKQQFAPDKRVAIYDIEIKSFKNKIIIQGESDQPEALEKLKEKISQESLEIIDSTTLLPDNSVGKLKYAVVNNSVANIRSNPKHSAELGTQALLGTGLKVLKNEGDFYRVQTPDDYISWVDHGGVTLMNTDDYSNWNAAEKIIYTKTFGFVYASENDETSIISDIVLGSQLKLIEQDNGFYKVAYPDNRIGYIKKEEGEIYSQWLNNLQASGELIENYAKQFLGSPYLWGGTSTKGMDCSGFTKTVYLMNGYIIPRDASQQIWAGEIVDADLKFEGLEKGDLLFFGTKATADKKQRVTHVGIWLGNDKGEFIHSSKQVRLSSIDSNSSYYDEGNTSRYLGSRRYLGVKDAKITNLKTDEILTDLKQ